MNQLRYVNGKTQIADCHEISISDEDAIIEKEWELQVQGHELPLNGSFDDLVKNKPNWIDPVKIKKGQKFAMENYAGIAFSEMLSLFILFASNKMGLDTLIYTKRSDTPYRAYRRYYLTSKIVKSWFETDLLTKGTKGNNNLQKVFQMHSRVQNEISSISNNDLQSKCEVTGNIMCPTLTKMQADFKGIQNVGRPTVDLGHKNSTITQTNLSNTLFGFFGLVLLYPEWFGIHNYSEEDFEGFVHLWKTIGYYMGINDDYNICRGTFEEVTVRCRQYVQWAVIPNFRMVTNKWEHMSRCAAEGIQIYMSGALPFSLSMCYLCDLLQIDASNLKESLGLLQRLKVWFSMIILKYMFKFLLVKKLCNHIVHQKLKKASKEFKDEEFQEKLKYIYI
ncbi:uncharacterized protein LOC126896604 isoform X2 [Daktulosphaira vitifoliae]|uniref:uncharacterized protein LOC126896604 isoform X2 n=1 Tax=Daktulosphaira vitifoliae TaxID=58002 RepID=UPI0021AA8469|nr:uncharacterized protein LOC126896604 isoform X2 [Daktulosphaira vitifoliae]